MTACYPPVYPRTAHSARYGVPQFTSHFRAQFVDFIDELETATAHLLRPPMTGSLRFSYELEIPGLRSWSIQKFPYLIFYIADDGNVDIWRVLHAHRDIPTYLTTDPPD